MRLIPAIVAMSVVTLMGPRSIDAEQFNVLFIAVDDLRVELGCYGSAHVKCPNIDQLATQGTLFERAYCQQTVCNASRASLLTGLRPDTLRVWDLPTHFRTNKPDVSHAPATFQKQRLPCSVCRQDFS
jgi:iduronate 2-sulfatase